MKIWFDITNTPQVHFLLGIRNILQQLGYNDFIFTVREFSETSKLLSQQVDVSFQTIGGHYGKNMLKKSFGLISRFLQVHQLPFGYDLSVSCGSESAIWSAWIKQRKSIAFGDNDTAQQWTYSLFVDFAFFPNAIPKKKLERQGLKGKLYLYNGYKEDIYLSFYKPDPNFLLHLPFTNYIVVRPENIQARYTGKRKIKSIVPNLLKKLCDTGYNVLYLPRYDIDYQYCDGLHGVFIPKQPMNGLDICYHADAVLTGAGTLAREAACLGVPAFSFYAGKELLAVDQKMIKEGCMTFSRDPDKLIQALKRSKRRETNLARSKAVQQEVMEKLKEVLGEMGL
jgi:hypothetical protein